MADFFRKNRSLSVRVGDLSRCRIDSGCRRLLGTLAREKKGVTYGTPGSCDTKASLPKQHHHRGCLYYYRHTYLCVEHARIGGGGKR